MILDKLHRADVYSGLGERYARAFAYLRQPGLAQLACGEYPIMGRDVFAIVQQVTTRPLSEGRWEAHRTYVDIQYVIQGVERMAVRDIDSLDISEPYDAKRDVLFLTGGEGPFVDVHAGQFCVFFPHDAHMPGLIATAPSSVRKVVIKIAVD